MGSHSAGEIPGIVLFFRFLAFRASDRNGCARLWGFGTGMRMALRESRAEFELRVEGVEGVEG
jgi:hypothetical protein